MAPPRRQSKAIAYYQTLRQRIILATLLVALLPVPLVAASFITYYNTYIRGAVARELTTLADSRKEAIEVFLHERLTLLRALAAIHSLDELARPGALAQVHDVLESQQAGLSDLGALDASGVQVAYSGPYQLLGKHYGDARWFQEAMRGGAWVSDSFPGLRGRPHVVVAVRREEGGKPWVLRASIDAATLHRFVKSARLGKTGEAFIINRDLQYQVEPRFPREATQGPAVLQTPAIGTTVTQIGPGPKRVFQAATWLNGGRWLLVVREDSSAEFYSLESAKMLAAGVFVLALIGVTATVVWMTNRLVARLEAHESELEEMSSRLARASRLASLGKLAAGVAHEVNNPLAVIAQSAGWMRELLAARGAGGEAERKEFEGCLEDIRSQVFRCREITERLLGFARESEPRLAPTDLNRVLLDAIQFVYKGGAARNVRIEQHLAEGLPPVETDASQLVQVFVNILDNALYALGQQGGGKVLVESRPEGGGVLVSISDNGPGVPPEARDKLFDPFFTTKPVGKGTGLGLSICYGIVIKLGGRLWAEHPASGGAVFKISLPASVNVTGEGGLAEGK